VHLQLKTPYRNLPALWGQAQGHREHRGPGHRLGALRCIAWIDPILKHLEQQPEFEAPNPPFASRAPPEQPLLF
jgi:hypothetical protein